MKPVEVSRGTGAVVLGLPHTGTYIPDDVQKSHNDTGHTMADTDWHIHKLYSGLLANVTTVRATFHRYVIDANRNPSGQSLYPGQNTTGLCPVTDFDGRPIYHEDQEPDTAEIERRRDVFHAPYHASLSAELERVHTLHGHVVLYDCHSIRSNIPYLFEGTLPDFNIGTDNGTTCAPQIGKTVREICERAGEYRSVINGRFRGGWTTRHYGRPANGVHAIQMELAQSTYMDEAPPWSYRDEKAVRIRVHLKEILSTLDRFEPNPNT